MSWNKASISANASLHAIAKEFSLRNNDARSHFLRAKVKENGTVVIVNKHFSPTKLLAIAGNNSAREKIRQERQMFMEILADKVAKEYSQETLEAIGLQNHASLRGYQIEPMQAHAAVAQAASEMQIDQLAQEFSVSDEDKEKILFNARENVFNIQKQDASAAERTHHAKVYLLEKMVAAKFGTSLTRPQLKAIQQLCEHLSFTTYSKNPNAQVARAMVALLESPYTPTHLALDNFVFLQPTTVKQQHADSPGRHADSPGSPD